MPHEYDVGLGEHELMKGIFLGFDISKTRRLLDLGVDKENILHFQGQRQVLQKGMGIRRKTLRAASWPT